MDFTEQDRRALYDTWMSQKAKMQITQMEMTRRLRINHQDFSASLRGDAPLTLSFITKLCEQLHVEPYKVIPSLAKRDTDGGANCVFLRNRVTVDGEVKNVYIDGNQVIIEYLHQVS